MKKEVTLLTSGRYALPEILIKACISALLLALTLRSLTLNLIVLVCASKLRQKTEFYFKLVLLTCHII